MVGSGTGQGLSGVVEVWEGAGRARPRSNRLLQQLEVPGLDLAPGDASEVSGGEVPNATMAMLRRWSTTACPGANWPNHVSAVEAGRTEQKETHLNGRDAVAEKGDDTHRNAVEQSRYREGGATMERGERELVVGGGDGFKSHGYGKVGSARRNGAADVAWPTGINIAIKPAGVKMERRKTLLTADLKPWSLSPSSPPWTKETLPEFWFCKAAIRPCV